MIVPPGFAKSATRGAVLSVGTTVTTNVQMSVSSTEQTVNVTAAAPVVDETGISVGTFGQISSTRFPIGDFGSSRQLQVSAKLVF